MRGSDLIENPFSKILKIQDRMFQVKRILPESRIKMNKFEEWLGVLYYGAKKEFGTLNGPFIKIF